MLNGSLKAQTFGIPALGPERNWHLLINSAAESPFDIINEDQGIEVEPGNLQVDAMAAVVLISKPKGRRA
jgi:hypothetical protein